MSLQQLIDARTAWNYLITHQEPSSLNQDDDSNHGLKKYGWFSLLCNLLNPAPTLPPELSKERDHLVSLAKCSFNHNDSVHVQMLLTLFYQLTGGLSCPSLLGSHWEIIGFQGLDPATDFRGVGLLGLLQPLALSACHPEFVQEVVNLSHSPSQGFPFMVLSLNITHMVLNSLKNGQMNRMFEKEKTVLDVVNLSYGAVLFYVYNRWKNENLSLANSGELLKRAETVCKKELDQCLKVFNAYVKQCLDARKRQASMSVRLEEVQFYINEEPSASVLPNHSAQLVVSEGGLKAPA